MEGKKDTDKWFPVILVDETDGNTGETGIAFGDVTVKYYGEGATSLSTYTVTTDDWKEAGEGGYSLSIGASEFTAEGKYEVLVSATGAAVYRFWVEVKDNTDAEFQDTVNATLGTDGKALISTDAQDLNTTLHVDAKAISGSTAAADAVEANIANLDDAITDAITAIEAVGTAVGALNDLSAAEVNAEVVDVMTVDTHAELAALPGATPTKLGMLQTAYELLRNKIDQTATGATVYKNDGTTPLSTRTDSDDGTDAIRGRLA